MRQKYPSEKIDELATLAVVQVRSNEKIPEDVRKLAGRYVTALEIAAETIQKHRAQ